MDYPEAFETWNKIASYGTYLAAVALSLWVIIVLRACFENGTGQTTDL